MATVGIVSPGAMGSAVGDALARGGARVVATLAGRSERTRGLAARAPALELLPDLEALVKAADVVLSIAPPAAAEEIGARLAGARLVADLNAVSPATVRRIGEDVELVDGAISGPPPWRPGTTRIYLSGPRAGEVAALPFDGVEVVVVGDEVGSASAVKMCTASVYKGSVALMTHALLTAHAHGVVEHVLSDLEPSLPELVDGIGAGMVRAATKAGRYVREMREIAATQEAAGLPPALFEALAGVYESLATRPAARRAPEEIDPDLGVNEALEALER